MLAVEARGLTKVYRSLFAKSGPVALAGLDLEVPRGTAFGLIGPNGAGKTTFIKTMIGVVRPTSGRVRTLGGDPGDVRVRARLGYLPERLHLPAAWTPLAFLASVARLKGAPADTASLRASVERVGLGEAAQRKIGGFSKGMRQRLGLAAALLGAPDLLVLDEPTDGIDPLGRAEIRHILAEERARGATLFLNSHLLSETERVCDRIGILAGGRLVREGALLDLCASGERWRARFAPGLDPAAIADLGCFGREHAGDGVLFCNAESPAALNDKLAEARSRGALLIELARDLRDLEDVLAEALGPRREAS